MFKVSTFICCWLDGIWLKKKLSYEWNEYKLRTYLTWIYVVLCKKRDDVQVSCVYNYWHDIHVVLRRLTFHCLMEIFWNFYKWYDWLWLTGRWTGRWRREPNTAPRGGDGGPSQSSAVYRRDPQFSEQRYIYMCIDFIFIQKQLEKEKSFSKMYLPKCK